MARGRAALKRPSVTCTTRIGETDAQISATPATTEKVYRCRQTAL